MTIDDIQNEIIQQYEAFDDWMDKYQMLIEEGNNLAPLPDKYKTEDNLIDGCQSRVWIVCDCSGGLMTFFADSDALIVKGIIALLLRVFNFRTPREILDAELFFIPRIGLGEHLSPTRAGGLLAIFRRILSLAAVNDAAKTDEL